MLVFRKREDEIRGRVYERETLESEFYETNRQTSTLSFTSNHLQTSKQTAPKDDADEELALIGTPWTKEGMLCRKIYRESSGKRAKVKSWLDVFVVIQNGELNMFENWLVSVFMYRVADLHNENAHSIRTMRIRLAQLIYHIPWHTHYRLLATANNDHIAWC
jgi:hypothetical protein